MTFKKNRLLANLCENTNLLELSEKPFSAHPCGSKYSSSISSEVVGKFKVNFWERRGGGGAGLLTIVSSDSVVTTVCFTGRDGWRTTSGATS
jgi:hypothetical protein